MLAWLLVIFVALMAIDWLMPALRRLGFGRMPGDFEFRALGRQWRVPLGSTVVLTLLVNLLLRLL